MKEKLPYIFDLYFDCKTKKELKNHKKYLEMSIEELKKLEELIKEHKIEL